MDGAATTSLVIITGLDRPGVTTELFAALAPLGAPVLDVEQVVIRGRLILGVLVGTGDADTVRARCAPIAEALGMQLDVSAGFAETDLMTSEPMTSEPMTSEPMTSEERRERAHVVVLGQPLDAGGVSAVAGRIAALGANIDRIVRLAPYPVTAIEFEVSGADLPALRTALATEAAAQGIDVAVERSGLHRRAKRLVVMDVDSTLIQGEVIDLLASSAGCLDQVQRITEAAMRGELDFEESLRARVRLLAGLPVEAVFQVRDTVLYTPGARTLVRTLRRLGYQFAVVSGGFTQITDHLVTELGIDFSAANTLEVVNGRLTGNLVGSVVDRRGKAEALERFAGLTGVPMSQTVAIGDGANDLDMLERAGLGIAFNAKPVVQQAADTAVNVPYLDAILYLLGISREEVEAADELAGIRTPAPPIP